ncbi:molecular chaperone HtpG [Chitinophaga ginsengisegetis]|uniref:molecular chaperone HtpG n=1 Tax=Chitinophaga ginsengisegetis TaxID=393003 RepID=UPI000DBAD899|nr:molecular chaperone HtpG [Chitinophaga ginsengisegetis]MDR6565341.1 molecular chaperone HtpG [Chitinophaga ginsengisegetis]MDR6645068.1 molecular chaperone HtpG [Chitinophaga ginsengisegetis]MDR6652340.1 molecular chaperone HtpG [Chitinophaga ginsengisegetis]
MQKGAIRVQTENIFPIIKKFLYSDHEIFIRELVSNAVDATQKLKTLASVGEFKGELGDIAIDVRVDKEKKTITIADHGIGMTAEEVDKYINQVAFSGAEEFLKKYKGQENGTNIIGHFGLGFYSSFMVSSQVEIFSKSWKEEAPAVRWECDGSPEYELEEISKADRGTEIVMHINEESEEFLEDGRIRTILEKFCKFLPVPVTFEGTQINNTNPAWTKKPSELTTEDYQNFYKELYPFAEPPLFWIHLNVDYPFNLTGILYFPKINKSYEMQKDKINLYSNQVYVTDEVKDIVPEFLMLLHGVIDSPDIPLNVSRSYLQGDPNVKKINAHITKKVADKLDEIFRNDRVSFEDKWDSIGLFVKYGMMTDDKFMEKANKFLIMEDVAGGKFYTQEEYRTAAAALQTNKEQKLVILYATNPVQQDSYVQAAKNKGFLVVKMETMVDAAFINNMEIKWDNVSFTRVDADIADNLIDKEENTTTVLSEEQEGTLKELFGAQVTQPNIKVEMKGLSAEAQPVIVTRPELMRRMKDMAAMGGGGMNWYANMPDEINMTINANHPVYTQILKEGDNTLQQKQIKNLADLALLSQNLLTGADLTAFVNRSVELMGEKK